MRRNVATLLTLLSAGMFFATGIGVAGEAEAQPEDFISSIKQFQIGGIDVTVTGEIRLRYEYWEDFGIGVRIPTTNLRFGWYDTAPAGRSDVDSFWLERATLGFNFQLSETARVFFELSQAYAGGFHGPEDEVPGIEMKNDPDIHQAYLELKLGSTPWALRVGRTELALGDERWQGTNDWANVRRMYDAAALIGAYEKLTLILWGGQVVDVDKNAFDHSDHNYDYYGIYASYKPSDNLTIDGYIARAREDDPDMRSYGGVIALVHPDSVPMDDITVNIAGIRAVGNLSEAVDFSFELAHEWGEVGDLTLNAWALHAGLGYTFPVNWSPRLGIEYNMATGDENLADGTLNTFITLFPSTHKFYGIMDLFGWQNIEEYALTLDMQPTERLKSHFAFRIFKLEEENDFWFSGRGDILGAPIAVGGSGRGVGKEVDIVLSYDVSDRLNVETGFATFFEGEYPRSLGLDNDAHFFYLQTTYKF